MKITFLLLAFFSISTFADTIKIPEIEIRVEGEGAVPVLTWDCYKEHNIFQKNAIKSDEKYNSKNPGNQLQIRQFDTRCGQMSFPFSDEGNGNFRLEAIEISKANWWGVRRYIRASVKFAEVNEYGDIIDTFGHQTSYRSNLDNRVGIFFHDTSDSEETESIFPVGDIPPTVYVTKSDEDGSILIEPKD